MKTVSRALSAEHADLVVTQNSWPITPTQEGPCRGNVVCGRIKTQPILQEHGI